MATVNQVILEGNLCKDAEFKQSKRGTKFSTFPLAVNRNYKDVNGNFQKETLFIDVEVWGEAFQKKIAEFGKKGQGVRLVGRLRQGKWEKDGKKYSKMFAIAETIDACAIGKHGTKSYYEKNQTTNELSNLASPADGMRNEIDDFSDETVPDDIEEESAVF